MMCEGKRAAVAYFMVETDANHEGRQSGEPVSGPEIQTRDLSILTAVTLTVAGWP